MPASFHLIPSHWGASAAVLIELLPHLQGWRLKTSMFRKLPPEITMLIMCHTNSEDLPNLIQSEKSLNEIFKTHKTCIFKRMQIYQFPEFSEWFGDLPGFDGPIPGGNRTPEQIQCLKDVVLAMDWRDTEGPRCSGKKAAREMLHLLEQHGGRRYLYFLGVMKKHVEEDAGKLYRISQRAIPSMSEGLAKETALCFFRMSLNAAAAPGGQEEDLADMPARVENRLKLFRQEPLTLQKLMTATLGLLIVCLAKTLQFGEVLERHRHRHQRILIERSRPAQRAEDFYQISSEPMTKMLLECFFYYGISIVLKLCEVPVNNDVKKARSAIVELFEQNLLNHHTAISFGIVVHVDPSIQEGLLWAAGLGFPNIGFARSGKA